MLRPGELKKAARLLLDLLPVLFDDQRPTSNGRRICRPRHVCARPTPVEAHHRYLAEAGKIFQEAVQANYKQEAQDKPTENLDEIDESASDEELEDGALPDAEEAHSSTDDNEVGNFPRTQTSLLTHYRLPTAIMTRRQKRSIPKRSTSLLRDRKNRLTPKLKLTLIENSRR